MKKKMEVRQKTLVVCVEQEILCIVPRREDAMRIKRFENMAFGFKINDVELW